MEEKREALEKWFGGSRFKAVVCHLSDELVNEFFVTYETQFRLRNLMMRYASKVAKAFVDGKPDLYDKYGFLNEQGSTEWRKARAEAMLRWKRNHKKQLAELHNEKIRIKNRLIELGY